MLIILYNFFLLKKWKIIPINKKNKRIFTGLKYSHNIFERKKNPSFNPDLRSHRLMNPLL
jgi:hypothetical protein|tara:strand:- start:82 stop:261 length:180 start_codon:yes stop_codon:yes gene_type:complete